MEHLFEDKIATESLLFLFPLGNSGFPGCLVLMLSDRKGMDFKVLSALHFRRDWAEALEFLSDGTE